MNLTKDAESRILVFLCRYPTRSLSLSEISEGVNISKPWTLEKINSLEEQGLVRVDRKGNQKFVQFNRDSDKARRLKRTINLNRFYSSGILNEIIETYSYPETVVLFGSFSKGEDVEESDVDIAVITDIENEDFEAELIGRKVSVQEFKPGKIDKNMLETLANGITVYGYLELME